MFCMFISAAASILIGLGSPGVDDLPPCCAARAAQSAATSIAPVDVANDAHDTDAADGSDDADRDEVRDPVEAVLADLELAAGELSAFTADVVYINDEALLGRRETRMGNLIYRVDPDTGKASFAVLFESLVIGTTRRDRTKHYIFNDGWVAEVDYESKQFISRQIVAPGREFDPLKLGEGPIPLPIGQSRHDVLARFDVTLIDPPDSGPLANLDNVHGLRLVPKPNVAEADEYQYVKLFYDRTTRLPIGIETLQTNDDRSFVRLRQVQHNPKLTEQQLQQLSIEAPDPSEWAIDVRPWRSSN